MSNERKPLNLAQRRYLAIGAVIWALGAALSVMLLDWRQVVVGTILFFAACIFAALDA